MIRHPTFAYLFVFSIRCLSGDSGPPQLNAWKEITLRGEITEEPGLLRYTPHHILGVAFSPNSNKLAVVAGMHRSGEEDLAHLLIFDLNEVGKKPIQVDVRTNRYMFLYAFEWSENGQLLFLQSSERAILVNTGSGTIICDSTNDELGAGSMASGGMSGNDSYLTTYFRRSSTTVWIRDSSCILRSKEAFSGRTTAGAVSGPLFALAGENGGITVREISEMREVLSIPDRRVQLSLGFAESGRMICAGTQPTQGDGSLNCWVLGPGEASLVSQYKVRKGGTGPVATAASDQVVLFPDRSFSYNGITERIGYRLKRYVIWDGESGKIRAVIAPIKQRPAEMNDPPQERLEDSTVFALSRDGKFAGVAAEDTVKIFQVPTR